MINSDGIDAFDRGGRRLLARLAITVWLAWLGVVGLMLGMLIAQVPHPHFLPMTVLFGTLIVAGLALIVGAIWRLFRGPDRGRALRFLLLGIAPLGFMAGHLLYGLRVGYGRQLDLTWPLRMLVPFAVSMMDLEARFFYPMRTVGEKVVMISAPFERPGEQVAAMDKHVRALEARLGRPARGRVHWVRGPLFRMDGRAIYATCIGSPPGGHPRDDEGLTYLDRHEVAHCVITPLASANSTPPSLLSEGWAEANSGHDPTTVAVRAQRQWQEDRALTLRELTGPKWYARHHWPAYVQGAALVNYLLREYGPERFLELYARCQPATFADDCKRILGVSLDDLDRAYQADIERIAGGDPTSAGHPLERLALGTEVDPAAWKSFLAEYLVATNRVLAPYEQVRMTTRFEYSNTDAKGKESHSDQHYLYARTGQFRAWRRISEDFGAAYLARPERSFIARRKRSTEPWEVEVDPKMDPAQMYRRTLSGIEQREYFSKWPAILLLIADELSNRVDSWAVTVEKLERFTQDGRSRIRVRLEDRTRGGATQWRSFTANLAADEHFVVLSDVIETGRDSILRGEFEYDRQDGIPVFRSCVSSGTAPGERTTTRITVVDRKFGPVPEEEFTIDRILDGPRTQKIVDPNESFKDPSTFADWYAAPLVAGVVSIAGGVAVGRFRKV